MSLSDLLSFAVLFLLLSIFLSYELFATGLPLWKVLLSWLLSAYLVGVLCFLLSQMLWPQGRLPLFVTAVFGFLTVLFNYAYLFPKTPLLDRAFCFFFVMNTATLLELGANVLAEEASVFGYADAIVETRKAVYVFEFKFNRSAKAAVRQIREKGYADAYKGGKRPVTLVGINFSARKRNIDEPLIESL